MLYSDNEIQKYKRIGSVKTGLKFHSALGRALFFFSNEPSRLRMIDYHLMITSISYETIITSISN